MKDAIATIYKPRLSSSSLLPDQRVDQHHLSANGVGKQYTRKRRCLLYHLFNYVAYRLEVFFSTLSKFVHVEMISGKRVFLRRFALIQAP